MNFSKLKNVLQRFSIKALKRDNDLLRKQTDALRQENKELVRALANTNSKLECAFQRAAEKEAAMHELRASIPRRIKELKRKISTLESALEWGVREVKSCPILKLILSKVPEDQDIRAVLRAAGLPEPPAPPTMIEEVSPVLNNAPPPPSPF